MRPARWISRGCSRCRPRETYNPDFVNPPPSGPLAEFEEELAVMIATPARQIRAEVMGAYVTEPCRRCSSR